MWKIYVIFALWIQIINGQYDIYSRSGDNLSRPIKLSNAYPEYGYNSYVADSNDTVVKPYNAAGQKYDTNSRDFNGNILNVSKQNITNPAVNLSPVLKAPSRKIPTTESFQSKLFEIMSLTAQHKNLVYSPISLQTLLAFIFTMSEGKLHEELAELLVVPNNRTYVAKTFENILQAASQYTPPTTLIMANKLYYDYRFGPIEHSVRNLAMHSFASELEQIDFLNSKKAANIINSWVSNKTRNLIKDIVTPSSLSSDTSSLLLNSIYFKSEWLTKFATYDTEVQQFFVTKQIQVPVDMMFNEDVFRYGDFSDDLQASVVELPYQTSVITMMLILPKDTEGLSELERKLTNYDFGSISQKLKREMVVVKLPRFKVEFEIDMIKTLQQMGLNALFNNAGHINLFKNQQKPLKVDQFKHKSFINVNEAGTEAAAITVAKYIPLSIPINIKYFIADHPFVFVIRNANTTFFIGHVVQF